MLALHDWQTQLQAAILQPADLSFDGSDALLGTIKRQGVIPEQRIGIYRDAYRLRLTEALHSNYPALARFLGESDFNLLSEAYIAMYPSAHPSIRWLGNQMAHFLQTTSPWVNQPICHELAAFEWALRHTVDASNPAPFTVNDMLAIPIDTFPHVQLHLQPAATLLSLTWNTPAVWRSLMEDEQTVVPEQCQQHWLVYRRQDLMALWRSIEPNEVAALVCVHAGCTFADLCEAIFLQMQDADNTPTLAAQLLRGWVDEGLVFIDQAEKLT